MNIYLLAVGKRMPQWVNIGYQEYAKRLPSDYQLHLIEVDSSKQSKSAQPQKIMDEESEALISKLPKNTLVIALDRSGNALTTREMATQLQQWHDNAQDIALLIGGAEGLSDTCLRAADQTWSLSKLTLPHPLVRVLVAEQMYRAFSILSHHPYHR